MVSHPPKPVTEETKRSPLFLRPSIVWAVSLMDLPMHDLSTAFLSGWPTKVPFWKWLRYKSTVRLVLNRYFPLLKSTYFDPARLCEGKIEIISGRTHWMDTMPGRYAYIGELLDIIIWRIHNIYCDISNGGDAQTLQENLSSSSRQFPSPWEISVKLFDPADSEALKRLEAIYAILEKNNIPSSDGFGQPLPKETLLEIAESYKYFPKDIFTSESSATIPPRRD